MEMHENLEKLVMCEGNMPWNNNVQCMAFNGLQMVDTHVVRVGENGGD